MVTAHCVVGLELRKPERSSKRKTAWVVRDNTRCHMQKHHIESEQVCVWFPGNHSRGVLELRLAGAKKKLRWPPQVNLIARLWEACAHEEQFVDCVRQIDTKYSLEVHTFVLAD